MAERDHWNNKGIKGWGRKIWSRKTISEYSDGRVQRDLVSLVSGENFSDKVLTV